MFCACSFHGNSMNNLLLYFGLVDARISSSEKDLPVPNARQFGLCSMIDMIIHFKPGQIVNFRKKYSNTYADLKDNVNHTAQ